MAKIKSFAELKRRLQPGTVVTMINRDHPPLLLNHGGVDATGIPRKVLIAQGNAVAFESVRADTDRPSWLYWPPATEVELLEDGTFKVRGMHYEIKED